MRVCAILTAVVTSAGLMWPQQQPPALSPEKLKRIEQAIMTEMSRRSIPGLSIAIGQGTQFRWEAAFGTADLENMVPMTTTTVMRTGSLAKPITAVAAMQLVEAGKMFLDAPIQRYVPTFPQKPWPITVRLLLCHQSGIRSYLGDEMQITRHYRDNVEALKIFQNDALLFEPGTKVTYTTYGYNVVGAAVEGASAMDYLDYVRERVFRPARMTFTDADDTFRIIPRRSRGYFMTAGGTVQNSGLANTSYKIPGGGMLSCPSDMVRFALAVNSNLLLKRESVAQMFSAQKLKDGRNTGWGLGWEIEPTVDGRKRVGHVGGQQGVTTHMVLYPQENLAIVVMLNLEQVPIQQITDAVARVWFAPN